MVQRRSRPPGSLKRRRIVTLERVRDIPVVGGTNALGIIGNRGIMHLPGVGFWGAFKNLGDRVKRQATAFADARG
jgi:hypothetical protein